MKKLLAIAAVLIFAVSAFAQTDIQQTQPNKTTDKSKEQKQHHRHHHEHRPADKR